MSKFLFILSTILSFGLNLVIAKLGVNPRWRYAVWAFIVANEIRGAFVVYQFGGTAFAAVS